ncbi:MAG: aminopeptidase P family protein [Gemmatimonadetes bacterium]|nr:aminopeptidase P family protein [Gemmatimonadota bacterium]
MLTKEGCRSRQQRLCARLAELDIDATVINHPKEIYYFTGIIIPEEFPGPPAIFWLGADGRSLLIAHTDEGEPCADECFTFSLSVGGTVTPDLRKVISGLIVDTLRVKKPAAGRLGWQSEFLPRRLGQAVEEGLGKTPAWFATDDLLADMQEVKDPDEIELLRKVVQVDLAAYAAAEAAMAPGVNELEVLAAAQRAAHLAAGEKVFHDGDYQCGEPGGFAHNRPIEAGEIYVIDAWSVYRGYWADLCRSFAVGEPTEVQHSVFEHVKGFHDRVGEYLRPGKDGSECAVAMDAYIREHPKLADVGLIHHAGHNIGLRAHEMPDLNKERGGTLRVGNVVSVEPGAYIPEARAGVRLENMYLITEDGLENLSPYPMELGAHC